MSAFFFATCRAGSEVSLKKEVAARYGKQLTPAFMRPQLITWKAAPELPADFDFQPVFAAVSGSSLGMARTPEEFRTVLSQAGLGAAPVHVFPRVVPEDGLPANVWDRMDSIRNQVGPPPGPASFQTVDLIVGEEGEPWFVGAHTAGPSAHPWPGALPRLEIPAEAPSRAWLKMEQALAWLGLDRPDALAGKTAVELGSAPGGASWSLLQRGMEVIGADTGIMDEQVMAHHGFTHLKLPAADVTPDMVPERVDLLASDMNLHPDIVLHYIEPMCRHLQPQWLVLTLKMNDARVEAQLPQFIDRVRSFAPGQVAAKQLHANRREITVVAGK